MLYIRPTRTSDTCHIKAVAFGNEFPLIRTQSLIRRTLGRKPLVLSSTPMALLQLLHNGSECERAKTISHSLPFKGALPRLPVIQEKRPTACELAIRSLLPYYPYTLAVHRRVAPVDIGCQPSTD